MLLKALPPLDSVKPFHSQADEHTATALPEAAVKWTCKFVYCKCQAMSCTVVQKHQGKYLNLVRTFLPAQDFRITRVVHVQ